MVSRKTNNKTRSNPIRKKATKRQSSATPRSRAIANIDANAAAFARLLADPCNAPLCAPTYTGMGTGEYRRYRKIITIPTTAVEGTYVVTPGLNIFKFATHIAANAGTNYNYSNFSNIYSPSDSYSLECRCLAACIKIRYTGAEQARSGVIGLRTLPFQYINSGQISNIASDMTNNTLINRVGEVMHEVKFVPGNADQGFTIVTAASNEREMGSFGFSFQGVPAGSLQIEITAVMEIESEPGIVPTSITPSSHNTLNQVLSALGPTSRWAFNNLAVPTIKSVATRAMQSITQTGASSAGRLLLTL